MQEEDALSWNLPPETFQSWETVGVSALSRGREAASPLAGRERGSVQALHNHYLG